MSELHALQLTDLEGNERSLSDYAGNVLLLVNVASRCGKTPQYKGLEELHQRYQERGFSVMGFPCNQFGKQEPGTAQEIRQFCDLNYGVTFPIFAKLEVNGANQHPLYALDRANRCISRKDHLNFEKFLVNQEGEVQQRFSPRTTPSDPELIQPWKRCSELCFVLVIR